MNFLHLLSIVKYSAIEFYVWENEITIFMPVCNEFVDPFWALIPKDAHFYALDWDDDYYHTYLGEWYSIPL